MSFGCGGADGTLSESGNDKENDNPERPDPRESKESQLRDARKLPAQQSNKRKLEALEQFFETKGSPPSILGENKRQKSDWDDIQAGNGDYSFWKEHESGLLLYKPVTNGAGSRSRRSRNSGREDVIRRSFQNNCSLKTPFAPPTPSTKHPAGHHIYEPVQ